MKNKNAFTMLELIFVIVIMGIIGKFGTEFLAQAYKNFISTKIQNKYQNQSMSAVELIAKRLQYRIKNSVIERNATTGTFGLLEGAPTSNNDVLEWVGYDVDGLRAGAWSGIYSEHNTTTTGKLVSPQTNTATVNTNISALSFSTPPSTLNDAAVYIIGSDSDKDSWGWDGNVTDINDSIKPIKIGATNSFESDNNAFNTADMNNTFNNTPYNSYQLAWSAYAVVFDPDTKQLWLHSDYQPWEGESYTAAQSKILIMEDVSDFKKKQTKGTITIKVCSKNPLADLDEGEFLICEEKTVL